MFGIYGLQGLIKPIFGKMGEDLNDTQKYAERISSLIIDTPECVKFKQEILTLGANARGMNGAFAAAVIEAKNAANNAKCAKPI